MSCRKDRPDETAALKAQVAASEAREKVLEARERALQRKLRDRENGATDSPGAPPAAAPEQAPPEPDPIRLLGVEARFLPPQRFDVVVKVSVQVRIQNLGDEVVPAVADLRVLDDAGDALKALRSDLELSPRQVTSFSKEIGIPRDSQTNTRRVKVQLTTRWGSLSGENAIVDEGEAPPAAAEPSQGDDAVLLGTPDVGVYEDTVKVSFVLYNPGSSPHFGQAAVRILKDGLAFDRASVAYSLPPRGRQELSQTFQKPGKGPGKFTAEVVP
ncbi:MAG TPA: hypothetical protein VF173_19435 [Thermoanaerobaculia bacterium]|nr:hypothetical protein [Thermoanaerobaculia bacterium]